uniref:DUF4592 domain-containing protein n=1 Tax=Poecilia formosa TaxID=48698 RepID=A0A096LXK3_POEFO
MESFSGDNEEGTEDVTKRKSSKIKSLKSRFFRRTKKTGAEADAKLSQSASDITAGKGLGSDEDLASQGTMGSRAFSHESIFLDDQVLSDPDPVRVSSQENVHSKIKSLQMKLQLQKMHFGPPPMVPPIRSPEEMTQQSEDFTFHGSNENSGEKHKTFYVHLLPLDTVKSQDATSGTGKIGSEQWCDLLPFSFQSTSQPISPPVFSGPNYSSPATAEAPVDFSTPAKFNASLDTSALRHRMSIKPRNQRASSKRKPSPGDLKVRARFERVQEQEQEVLAQEGETVETDKGQANLSQLSPLTFGELSPVSSEVASKLPSQDNALPEAKAFPILRVKPPGQLDASPTQRPHSSYIDSEIKEKKELDLERQVTSQNKRNAFFASMTEVSSEQLSPLSSWLTSRSPLTQQQQPKKDEDISTRIKRQSSGSDSFRLSGNWDEERPRSGSFTGLQEKSKPRTKSFGVAEEKIAKDSRKNPKPRLENSGEQKRKSRTEEKITREKEEDTYVAEVVRVVSTPEVGDEAAEAKELPEDETRTPFGVKLRSTSRSFKFRSETASQRQSATLLSDDQDVDTKKRQKMVDGSSQISEKILANTSSSPRSPGESVTTVVFITFTKLDKTATIRETQPSPQASSSDVSWVSLAMEKTRSLQHLLTRRFQRDFTGTQTGARPKSQEETITGPQVQNQTVKTQQSTPQLSSDKIKEESVQSSGQEQAVKPSTPASPLESEPAVTSAAAPTLDFALERREKESSVPTNMSFYLNSKKSSPSRVLEKPREDKWTRKNVELPSSPSSLRTHSSALHSDSSQPSWMEVAKRKSMAWSDKSMD